MRAILGRTYCDEWVRDRGKEARDLSTTSITVGGSWRTPSPSKRVKGKRGKDGK